MEVIKPVRQGLTNKVTTHLPEYMDEHIRTLANQAGCSQAELIRDILCLNLYGMTWGEHTANVRRSLLIRPVTAKEQQAYTVAPTEGQ